MSLSPARQHRLRVQAEQAARQGGNVRHATGYDLMLMQLAEDRRRLKRYPVHCEESPNQSGTAAPLFRLGGGGGWLLMVPGRMTW
ncbi:terminase, endonuclease subunit (GpM) [Klebsiella pneumoniae]|uniref:Terminase, endonuclease subunit (GpM) n=1 Tax=Klebsiella pneumoniae TaxID=573 RepID=A0A377U0G7_KLEPN|nr:terminase, endonuclease subunit (GpM) [Klebsiella pneumoniae]